VSIELKQPRAEIMKHPARFKVLVTGRRWGKTYFALIWLHRGDLQAGRMRWFVAPTYRQGKLIAWALLKELHRKWGLYQKVSYSETELIATFPNGFQLGIKGADNEDSLRGVGLDAVVLEEYAFMKANVWGEIIRPMLADYQAPALFIGTPDGLNHFYDHYQKGLQSPSEWQSWQFKSIEGGYIDPAEIEAARGDMDERTYRQEFEASFETVGNRVYYSFDRKEHHERRDDLRAQPLETIIGMDFNVGKMSAVLGWRVGKDFIHWYDEVILRDSNTFEMAEVLKQVCRGATIYPDPAGSARKSSATKSDHAILRDAGFNVIARRAHPPVRDRVNAVNSRFKAADGSVRMTIDVDKCKELVADLERVQWRGGDIDKRDDERTHSSDAMGYAVEYLFPVNRGFVGAFKR